MRRMRATGDERIVIVSNYTQTLDIVGQMCRENNWPFLRLDGTTSLKKRQKMVDEFNDPLAQAFAFLLSSKAGGCGLNLIGGNRLVLFDPDWNPAIDKQAAARVWRDGQKRRCFIYRFVTTGTIEEKIFMRQLSKEGLQSIVEDKQQVNSLSSKDLRKLFIYNDTTASETHSKLACRRCPPESKVRGKVGKANRTESLNSAGFNSARVDRVKGLVEELKGWSKYDDLARTLDELASITAAEGAPVDVTDRLDLNAVILRLEAKEYATLPAFSKYMLTMFNQSRKRVEDAGLQTAQGDILELEGMFQQRWARVVPELIALKDDDQPEEGGGVGGDPMDESVGDEGGDDDMGSSSDLTTSFQPQVEMPTEEDLKNWSHHWTVRTVDDPTMREALQGREESISFLFGLEVTWDLLQRFPQPEPKPKERPVVSKEKGAESDSGSEEEVEAKPQPKRGRGRPRKEVQPLKKPRKAVQLGRW